MFIVNGVSGALLHCINFRVATERSYVSGGDYSPNYAYAKESFVRRSGLIQEQRLFQPAEAENLYRCVDYARNHCGSLTFEQSKALDELAEMLSYGYPEIEKNHPTFEPEDGPQLNL